MKTILEENKYYNDWLVVCFDKVDDKRRRRYFCKCRCGYETSMVASAIATGRTKCCKSCCRLKLVGRQFDDWVVLEYAGVDKHQKTLWKCRCKCGKEAIVSGGNLTTHKSHCCFDCGHNVSMKSNMFPTSWWYKTMRAAGQRGWQWDITEEDAFAVLEKQNFQCMLTGIPLTLKPMTASLDRIDSKSNYTKDNIQWLHKHINMMKFKYSNDYFVEMCCKVAKHHSQGGV